MMLSVLPREGGVTGQKKDDWTGGIWILLLEEFKNNARISSLKPPLVWLPVQSIACLVKIQKTCRKQNEFGTAYPHIRNVCTLFSNTWDSTACTLPQP